MTLRHLRAFAAVCDCGSVTKAAEKLNIAQPAVSAAISEIEKYYGIALFERINQRLVITPRGSELLLKAKETLASFEDFEKSASNEKNEPSVRIGATMTIGKIFIPELLKRIKSGYPETEPYVRICRSSDIGEAILSGELDFALTEGQTALPGITAVRFSTDRLTAVCGKEYPVPGRITAKELSRLPLLLREKGSASRDMTDKVFSELRLSFTPLMESSGNDALVSAVRENIGVSVLPFGIVKNEIASGELREIAVEGINLAREYDIIYHKGKRIGGNIKNIIDMCMSLFGGE